MIYLFLAEGFEEIEALTPLDILRRADQNIKTVGVGGKIITGAHGISVTADIMTDEVDFSNIDAVILPGGMPGTLNLKADKTVEKAVLTAYNSGRLVAAICAAPLILGNLGLLKNREAICYPGFENELEGAKISDNNLAISGNIITAAGAGVAAEFGFSILDYLSGNTDKSNKLRHAMKYI